MRKIFLAAILGFATLASAQFTPWSGIIPDVCANTGCTSMMHNAVDWSSAGIPGGIPSGSWTQSGSTILASACSNGTADCTTMIQTALNACGTNHFVLLGSGTFLTNSTL